MSKQPCFGIVVWCDEKSHAVRLWLFDKLVEYTIDTGGNLVKAGDWFELFENEDESWTINPISPILETRINDWRVEIKIPVMPMEGSFDSALKLDASQNVLLNMLLSPIVGKVAVYLGPMECFKVGHLYDVWATSIPDENERLNKIKVQNNVCWMMGNQFPTPIDYGNLETLCAYKKLNNQFDSFPGVVLKSVGNTKIVLGEKIGICLAVNMPISIGDHIEFIPVTCDYIGINQIIASDCVVVQRNFIEPIPNKNQFKFSILVSRSCFELSEYSIEPFGTIKDINKIVSLSCIGNLCLMTIQYSMDIASRQIAFWIVNVEMNVAGMANGNILGELGGFSNRIQPSMYLPETKLIEEVNRETETLRTTNKELMELLAKKNSKISNYRKRLIFYGEAVTDDEEYEENNFFC